MADVKTTGVATVDAITTDTRKAAVYCRVASADDNAMDNQRHLVLAYAAEQGYEGVVSYCDNGAKGIDFNRRALNKLNADIAAGKIGVVFARSIDRFGRDLAETVRYIDALKARGVKVVTMDGICDDRFYKFYVQAVRDVLEQERKRVKKLRAATEAKAAKSAKAKKPVRKGGAVNGA